MGENTLKKLISIFESKVNRTALQKENIKFITSAIPKVEKSNLKEKKLIFMMLAAIVLVLVDVFILMRLDQNGGKLFLLGLFLIFMGTALRSKSKENKMFIITITGGFAVFRAVLMFLRENVLGASILMIISSPLVFAAGMLLIGIGIVSYYKEKSESEDIHIKIFDLKNKSTMYLIAGIMICMNLCVR